MKDINKKIIDSSEITLKDKGDKYKIELTIDKKRYNEIMTIRDPKDKNSKEPTVKELLVGFIAKQEASWAKQEAFNNEVKEFIKAIVELPTIKKELADQNK